MNATWVACKIAGTALRRQRLWPRPGYSQSRHASCTSSPPSISRAVGRLEKKLQIRLFHRTSRHFSITHKDTALLNQFARLVQECDNVMARKFMLTPFRGLVRITAPTGLGDHCVVLSL
ncbi:LysR family transcriptional regulator [Formicincola oecophyllae]|uniref:LysR family transcriptional regulator n=1 Tax=Formicincola oecophyllae TaxID=2558361 RepID=A0A4Y6U9X7_9PROT|nr:LysR family transcriptional regulator [Formicincola oecophyllae]